MTIRTEKSGVNAPCPCGQKRPDGRPIKYKKCCIGKEQKEKEDVIRVITEVIKRWMRNRKTRRIMAQKNVRASTKNNC